MRLRRLLYATIVLVIGGCVNATTAQQGVPKPAQTDKWPVNAALVDVQRFTIEGLGAAQGISIRDEKIYLYGDVAEANPRSGAIREYTLDLKTTGRHVWLTADGKPLLRHPTGLTWHERWGTFIGDTVDRKAVIYRIDWKRAWDDGNLNHAVLEVIEDDAAINGCRPEFVTVNGETFLATADYGDVRPEVRLYDPAKLIRARRSSAPGVVVYRFLCGPFNQNLSWDPRNGQLVCVQNIVEGRGWQLDVLDLPAALADGRAWGSGVRVKKWTFSAVDELEGFRALDGGKGIFVTASRKDNVVIARIKEVAR